MALQPRTQRFEQVKTALTNAIVNGQFMPGDRLPSLRNLCAHFDVSLVTVQRAVQELKDEEWLVASARKGISVAKPLPPMAHLMRQRVRRRMAAHPARETEPARAGGIVLKCLVYDEALLPPFEWAAKEYADAYAPCTIRFEVQPLPGRDDEESMRTLDADLALLPSYCVNRAARVGAITPIDGMLDRAAGSMADIPEEILARASCDGKRWGVPLMMSGPVLVANEARCRRAGIDWQRLTSVEALLTALEEAAGTGAADHDAKLFNLNFLLLLVIDAGYEFPGIARAPEMLAHPGVRSLLERMRRLARHHAVPLTRFDQWDAAALPSLAVRHQPSGDFCRDAQNRAGTHVLPLPQPAGRHVTLWPHCLCVTSFSVHPYEAWEWAVRLSDAPFQTRLAELGYDIPVSLHPDVQRAFGRAVGEEHARTLQEWIRRPSRLYGMGPEDGMRYLWEVTGNEIYRFVAGVNDYERFLERLKTKTDRFLRRSGEELPAVSVSVAAGGADVNACKDAALSASPIL